MTLSPTPTPVASWYSASVIQQVDRRHRQDALRTSCRRPLTARGWCGGALGGALGDQVGDRSAFVGAARPSVCVTGQDPNTSSSGVYTCRFELALLGRNQAERAAPDATAPTAAIRHKPNHTNGDSSRWSVELSNGGSEQPGEGPKWAFQRPCPPTLARQGFLTEMILCHLCFRPRRGRGCFWLAIVGIAWE